MPYLLHVAITSVITDGSARLCDVLHTALVRALNIVAEWEECIGSKCHTLSADPAMHVFLLL